jgi:hypothetical protein
MLLILLQRRHRHPHVLPQPLLRVWLVGGVLFAFGFDLDSLVA